MEVVAAHRLAAAGAEEDPVGSTVGIVVGDIVVVGIVVVGNIAVVVGFR